MRTPRLSRLQDALLRVHDSSGLLCVLATFGVTLRLSQYLFNRSLWADEAAFALAVMGRSYSEIVHSPNCAAPLGFLFIQRGVVGLFGDSEYALRLFPLCASLLALFLFWSLARDLLSRRAVPLALGLFVIGDRLTYYATEAKQYSSDVAVCLLVFALALKARDGKSPFAQGLAFGAAGVVALWVSHPAAFVLAGMGACLAIRWLRMRDWRRLACLGVNVCIWATAFAVHYGLCRKGLGQNASLDYLDQFWSQGFLPFPPRGLEDLRWPVAAFLDVFTDPGSFEPNVLAALMFAIGCHAISSRSRFVAAGILAPWPFIFLASALHRYPAGGRPMLFIVPLLLLAIAEGLARMRVALAANPGDALARFSASSAVLCGAVLVFQPGAVAVQRLFHPRTVEELRPVMQDFKKLKRDEDHVFVYYGAVHSYQYYARRLGLNNKNVIQGAYHEGDWEAYKRELDQLRGLGRTWIVFSHVRGDLPIRFVNHLNTMGKQILCSQSIGAAAYLYDMSEK